MSSPKYSILLPTRNGIKFLPTCIRSIVSQKYDDYELIVSDNHSIDGTASYLHSINDTRVHVFKPEKELAMVDHFEWITSKASGRWVLYIGDDDGLQPYFFRLADRLTELANARRIRAITSRRAYFFWKGCEEIYGNMCISYDAQNAVRIKRTVVESLRALSGRISYFELPQCYTYSLFRMDLISEAARRQGRLFTSVNPDANLASIACSLDRYFLYCGIPLGWVGSSPKSTGFSHAVIPNETEALTKGRQNEERLSRFADASSVGYNAAAGDLRLQSVTLFYWESLLQTRKLRSWAKNLLFLAFPARLLVFSSAFIQIVTRKDIFAQSKLDMLRKVVETNGDSYLFILLFSRLLKSYARAAKKVLRITRRLHPHPETDIAIRHSWAESQELSMESAGEEVARSLLATNFLANAQETRQRKHAVQ